MTAEAVNSNAGDDLPPKRRRGGVTSASHSGDLNIRQRKRDKFLVFAAFFRNKEAKFGQHRNGDVGSKKLDTDFGLCEEKRSWVK